MSLESINNGGKRKKKSKWILGIIIMTIAILCACIYFFFDEFVKSRIVKRVESSTEGTYTLQIEELSTEFRSGGIKMKGVVLKPDKRELKLSQKGQPPDEISEVGLSIDYVSISSVNWIPYLLSNNDLEVGVVLISKPGLVLLNRTKKIKESKKHEGKTFLEYAPRLVAAFTGALHIESIHIVNGTISVNSHSTIGVLHQVADSIDIKLAKIVIDTTAANTLNLETAYLDFRNYHLSSPNNIHSLKVKRFYGTVEDSILKIEKVDYYKKDSVVSNYSNSFKLKVELMESKGVNFKSLLQDKKVIIRTLTFKHPVIEATSDKIPFNKKDDKPEKINQFTFLDDIAPYIHNTFAMDTFSFEDGCINYKIKNSKDEIFHYADHIYFALKNVKIDSTKNKYYRRIDIENADFRLTNLKYSKDSSLYAGVDSITASVKDSLLYLQKIELKSRGDFSFYMYNATVSGTGVNYKRLINAQQLTLNDFSVKNPDIIIEHWKKKKVSKSDSSKAQHMISSVVGSLADLGLCAQKLRIVDGRIKHIVHSKTNTIVQNSPKVTIAVANMNLDSSSSANKQYFENVNFNFKDYTISIDKSNVELSMEGFEGNSKYKNLKLKNVTISQTKIKEGKEKQVTYFISNAFASELDFEQFFKYGKLNSNFLDIREMDIKVMVTKNQEIVSDVPRSSPQDLIRKLPFSFTIDSIRISDSKVTYIRDGSVYPKPSFVVLDKLNISVYNFTNDRFLMTDKTPSLWLGSTSFMNSGMINFKVTIPLLSEKFDAVFSGTLDTIPASAFNNLLVAKGLQADEGRILPGEFIVGIKDGNATGKLKFVYEDLHVKAFENDTHNVSKLKSAIGNFIIKDDNLSKKGQHAEVVPLCGKRMPNDGFLNFFLKVLQEGIVTTVTKDTIYKKFAKK